MGGRLAHESIVSRVAVAQLGIHLTQARRIAPFGAKLFIDPLSTVRHLQHPTDRALNAGEPELDTSAVGAQTPTVSRPTQRKPKPRGLHV